MRKHNLPLSLHSNTLSTTTSPSCVDTPTTKCFTTHEFIGDSDPSSTIPTGQIDLTNTPYNRFTSFVFYSCLFRDCKANYGGGIYLKAGSTVSLTVSKGEFYSCKAAPYRGGGIYVEGIGEVHIEDTLLFECIAEAQLEYGGAGIEMVSLQKPPRIESCAFISCSSGDDAGGLGIWFIPVYQETCDRMSFYCLSGAVSIPFRWRRHYHIGI